MAIQATVLCTNSAVFFETPLKLLSSTMDPHVEIVPANTEACCHSVRRFFVQIELSNQTGVLRRHRRQQSLDARADNALFLVIRRRIDFMLEFRERSVACITAAVKIDDRSPKNPVEPCLGIFVIANLIGSFQRFEQTILNGVGGKLRITDAPAGKANKLVQMFEQSAVNCLDPICFHQFLTFATLVITLFFVSIVKLT